MSESLTGRGPGNFAPKDDPSSGKFQKGNTNSVGNPARRRSRVLTQQLISMLSEMDPREGDPRKNINKTRRVLEKLYEIAVGGQGDLEAIKFLFERIDGKMPQPLKLPGMDDDDDGDYEFTIRIGQRAADGTETAAEVRIRPAVDVPEAAGGDILPDGFDGDTGPVRTNGSRH